MIHDWEDSLRYLEGRLSPKERQEFEDRLKRSPASRRILRSIAENAIVVSDTGRMRAEAQRGNSVERCQPAHSARPWLLRIAAILVVSATAAASWFWSQRQVDFCVVATSGSSEFFSAGQSNDSRYHFEGSRFRPGSAIMTHHGDAWVSLRNPQGAKLSIAGLSELRAEANRINGTEWFLKKGNLWLEPVEGRAPMQSTVIRTPTGVVTTLGARLDLQTESAHTLIRVHEGEARVRRLVDGLETSLSPGERLVLGLERERPLRAIPQREPLRSWRRTMAFPTELAHGRWLPSTPELDARLAAEAMLWPLDEENCLLLYAVAVPVAIDERGAPIELTEDSVWRFRGACGSGNAEFVRFGFSTQKLRGAFSGKFETDVPLESMRSSNGTWELRLPLHDFSPLQPELSSTVDGLELTWVYALTVQHSIALELHAVELIPRSP